MIKQVVTLKIIGMHCANCELRIEKHLGDLDGVIKANASFKKSSITITYDEDMISLDHIIEEINHSEYKVEDKVENTKPAVDTNFIAIIIIIFGVYLIAREYGILEIFQKFPLARAGMGYGALFLVGLMTSIHCIAMCGGINISQSAKAAKEGSSVTKSNIQYNLGRVVSYTIVGGIIGGIGSVFSMSYQMKSWIQMVVGVFMIIMGLNLFGIKSPLRRLNLSMPKGIIRILNSSKRNRSSFYVGVINGFMPCGPLQSMQIYALSTGSIISGALSMFMFSIGTVPLMLGVGLLSGKLNQKFMKQVMKVSAILVMFLGISMFQDGATLSGFGILPTTNNSTNVAVIKDGKQYITTNMDFGSFEAITVVEGIPVVWNFYADEEKLNGCNNEIVIPEFDINIKLKEGENYIEFTPQETGTYLYSCWMGMIRSTIQVVEDNSITP